MRILLDIETNGLNPDKIHVCVCKDIDTNEVHTFYDAEAFKKFLKDNNPSLVVGHNLIHFDHHWLAKLWDCHIPREVCRDTLVLSRLYKQQLPGGHSLEAWGHRLGHPKQEHADFETFSPELLSRCVSDVHLNHKVYIELERHFRFPNWRRSIQLEHDMSFLCRDMSEEGFGFNETRAKELLGEIQNLIKELDAGIQKEFPPIKKIENLYRVRYKKDGTLFSQTQKLLNDPFVIEHPTQPNTLVKWYWEEFNPQSSKQINERLQEHWNPVDRTDGYKDFLKLPKKEQAKDRLKHYQLYGWRVNEVNLGTLKDDAPDAAKILVKRIMLGSRERTLLQWLAHSKDNVLHGQFDTLGTWTHRMSHNNPNLGNVSAEKTIKYKGSELRSLAIHYGGEFRRLFIAKPDCFLVGTDMEGAHLRLFAHYIDDKDLIQALVSGDKRNGTDPHTLNKQKLGEICPDRDLAKTFVFTFLNGGGYGKVAEIFQCSMEVAKGALDGFIQSYPGLVKLRETQIPIDAKRGYFKGLDGRHVPCDSEHHMIAGYLQNGEAVVVKTVTIRALEKFRKEKLPVKVVNIVHDEIQFEVKGPRDVAEYVAQESSKLFEIIGKEFGVRCPLAGESKIGLDWHESH